MNNYDRSTVTRAVQETLLELKSDVTNPRPLIEWANDKLGDYQQAPDNIGVEIRSDGLIVANLVREAASVEIRDWRVWSVDRNWDRFSPLSADESRAMTRVFLADIREHLK